MRQARVRPCARASAAQPTPAREHHAGARGAWAHARLWLALLHAAAPFSAAQHTCADGGPLSLSGQIPSPPKLSDEEMVRVLATGDNSNYTVPMSVGEPHAELDTAKAGCTVYDCIMSTEAFEEIKKRAGMREFFIELAMAQIEHKYKTLLSRGVSRGRARLPPPPPPPARAGAGASGVCRLGCAACDVPPVMCRL